MVAANYTGHWYLVSATGGFVSILVSVGCHVSKRVKTVNCAKHVCCGKN